MPKGTEYKIAWSKTRRAYELDHTPFVFPLNDDSLGAWLKMIDAFHLETASGHSLTARKETRQRGTAYWYAYKRVDGKLQKKYLGEGSKITLAMLLTQDLKRSQERYSPLSVRELDNKAEFGSGYWEE